MLQEGMQAPAFTLADKDGKMVSLSDFLGKMVVLFFYPKDNTPGCTRQACAFASAYSEFEKKMPSSSASVKTAFLRTKNLRKSIICLSFCCPIPNCRQFRHTVYGRRKNCTEKQTWASSVQLSSLMSKAKL